MCSVNSTNTTQLLHEELRSLSKTLGGPLLALDTSVAEGSLATVLLDGYSVEEQTLDAHTMPSETIVTALDTVLTANNRRVHEFAAMVVGLGPGSFTGLRVALATIKGLAFGSQIPVYGISSLALMAAGVPSEEPKTRWVAPILDARHGQLFSALYQIAPNGQATVVLDDAVRTPLECKKAFTDCHKEGLTIVGCTASAYADFSALSFATFIPTPTPRAATGLITLRSRLLSKKGDTLDSLIPRYLQVSEAERQQRTGGQHPQ